MELSLKSLSKLGVADVNLFGENVYPPALIYHTLPSLYAAGTVCVHCKAMRWREERSTFCCGNGKITLPSIPSLPDAIATLYNDAEFLKNIADTIMRYPWRHWAWAKKSFGRVLVQWLRFKASYTT